MDVVTVAVAKGGHQKLVYSTQGSQSGFVAALLVVWPEEWTVMMDVHVKGRYNEPNDRSSPVLETNGVPVTRNR